MTQRAPITVRARTYLSIAGCRAAGMALWAASWQPELWARSDLPLLSAVPLAVWAAIFTVHAVTALAAAAAGNEHLARIALLFGAMVTASWAAGLCIGWLTGAGIGFAPLAVTWAALALKDLVVCGMPLRSPLEELAAATVRDR